MLKKILVTSIVISLSFTGYLTYKHMNSPDIIQSVNHAAYQYNSLEQLADTALVIVKGKVVKDGEVKKEEIKNEDDDVDTFYYNDKFFKVQKVYKGTDIVKSSDEIMVRTDDVATKDIKVVGDRNVEKDKSYILFLAPSEFPVKNGAYSILGVSQGKFEIKDGDKLENIKFKNKSVKDLEEQLDQKDNK